MLSPLTNTKNWRLLEATAPGAWMKKRVLVAGLLFWANMMLLLALVKKEIIPTSTNTSSGQDVVVTDMFKVNANSKNALPRRLPRTFRMASPSECPAARQPLTDFAPASMESKIPYSQQKDFVFGGYKGIAKGSGDYNLVGPLTMMLSKAQHEQGIFGTVAELGVHHGRFTGALYMTARKTEKLLAADLFEELQHQNVDLSGRGNRQAFDNGLESYGLAESDLHLVHSGSTEDLPFDWHEQEDFEPFRLISVDAGHTAELTFNDMEIAFCNSAKGAIVILDDFFHNHWPGVTEGFFQFSSMGPSEGVYPFLRCEGKNFVTNDKTLHDHYYKMLRAEPKFKLFLNAYAHQARGSKVKYMMNGVDYLKCDSSKLTRETMHIMWNSLVY